MQLLQSIHSQYTLSEKVKSLYKSIVINSKEVQVLDEELLKPIQVK